MNVLIEVMFRCVEQYIAKSTGGEFVSGHPKLKRKIYRDREY